MNYSLRATQLGASDACVRCAEHHVKGLEDAPEVRLNRRRQLLEGQLEIDEARADVERAVAGADCLPELGELLGDDSTLGVVHHHTTLDGASSHHSRGAVCSS